MHSFKDVSKAWGTGEMKGYYNGAAYADLNNDGNLDLVINCIDAPAVILKNNAPGKNYLSLSFQGRRHEQLRYWRKSVFVGPRQSFRQQRYAIPGVDADPRFSVFFRHHVLHFGLDSLNSTDSLLIVWPDQKYQLIKNVPVK